jgi:hypothetical protein
MGYVAFVLSILRDVKTACPAGVNKKSNLGFAVEQKDKAITGT